MRKLNHKVAWGDPRPEELWLTANDLRADALSDLSTNSNTLSIWEESNQVPISRILAAVAATRDIVGKVDFIVFDYAVLPQLGIAHARILGQTPDAGVNACHIDLIQLTAAMLAQFGGQIRSARKADRILDKRVLQLIQASVDQRFIDRSLLKPVVAAKIEAL